MQDIENANVLALEQMEIETRERFYLRQIIVRTESNQKRFELLHKMVENGAEILIRTPRVDQAGHRYDWTGIRKGSVEFDFKLVLNAQIEAYLDAFLYGRELPEVTDFEPDAVIEDANAWIESHKERYSQEALSSSQELSLGEYGDYLVDKLVFPKGKIIYPGLLLENLTDLFQSES